MSKTFLEVIVDYIKTASAQEVMVLRTEIEQRVPNINPITVLENLTRKCTEMYDGTNKLSMVKYIKDVTGWGLKEAKDWADTNIPFRKSDF